MNTLFRIIMGFFQPKNYNLQNFAIFLLVLFNIQYIPLESLGGVSMVKVATMAICPLIFFLKTFKLGKIFMWMALYYGLVMLAAWMHPETFRASTVIYLAMFILMFITYHNLIYLEEIITFDLFLKVVKGMIMAFTICLVLQQISIRMGYPIMPIINLVQILDRSIGANSLSFEPSSAARTMAVLFLAMLRLYEIKFGHAPSVKELYIEARWPTLGFLWSMLTMGSGTAFVALALLAFYFIKKSYALTILPILIVIYFFVPYIDFSPLQRAYEAVNAAMTLDTDEVIETDTSAATRITPMINTFTNLDLMDFKTWFGHGIDYGISFTNAYDRMKNRMLGGVAEYGLLSFIVMIIVVFKCVIKNFISVETLLWLFLFGLSFSNISYVWGAMMIFASVRYFQIKNDRGLLVLEENEDEEEIETDNLENDE